MYMFKEFLSSIPTNRSEMVNDLELDDIPTFPYDKTSKLDNSVAGVKVDRSDSSLASSRAMSDSEIDYSKLSNRMKTRYLNSDLWNRMIEALNAFPADYIESLRSFSTSTDTESSLEDDYVPDHPLRNEELLQEMERNLADCTVFLPDDPGLLELQKALENLDLEAQENELKSTVP